LQEGQRTRRFYGRPETPSDLFHARREKIEELIEQIQRTDTKDEPDTNKETRAQGFSMACKGPRISRIEKPAAFGAAVFGKVAKVVFAGEAAHDEILRAAGNGL
jgi:hypothetical protein